MGLTAVAGAIHYLLQGPNTVSRRDEEEANRLAGKGG
jgi:hypothetical protein